MPKPKEKNYRELVSKYVDFYLQTENERYCFLLVDHHRIDNIIELIISLNLSARQIQEVFRIMGHVFQTNEEKQGRLRWCIGVGTILMSALKIGNSKVYDGIGKNYFSVRDAAIFFKKLSPDYGIWWFKLWISGSDLNNNNRNEEDIEMILHEEGLLIIDQEFKSEFDLSQWHSGWGHVRSPDRFKKIYENIEEITSWS